jgi:hypothetical protein
LLLGEGRKEDAARVLEQAARALERLGKAKQAEAVRRSAQGTDSDEAEASSVSKPSLKMPVAR